MRIVLMGPPGAGKGTQAVRLVEKFGFTHLSSGDIFRAEKTSGSELGKKLAEYMNAGKLVPDEIVVEMMAKAITKVEGGLMLDGFPRTVDQAKALDEQLQQAEKPLDAVVVITADIDNIVQRITGRRTCSQCGRGYHVTNIPPRKENICDDCGVELTQRDDDNEEVVRQRLTAYTTMTEPVIEYYRGTGVKMIQVDGNLSLVEVSSVMIAGLEALRS